METVLKMQNFVDSLMNSSFNLVKRIPSKLKNLDDMIYNQDEEKKKAKPQNKETTKEYLQIPRFGRVDKKTREEIKQRFIDTFRSMTDFSIPALTKDDPDYEEFKNDPKVPLLAAVSKIVRGTQFECIAYPCAIILLRRIFDHENDGRRKISINNMHRLLVISLMTANKFIEDTPASNYDFAINSGFTNEAINTIELEFLECLDYDVFIADEEVNAILEEWNIKIKE